jgi:hypothetical protein
MIIIMSCIKERKKIYDTELVHTLTGKVSSLGGCSHQSMEMTSWGLCHGSRWWPLQCALYYTPRGNHVGGEAEAMQQCGWPEVGVW